MHTKSTVKYETFGGEVKGSETRANRIDKNSGFTHRPLQNRSEKPNSKQTRLKPQKEAHFLQKTRQTAARGQRATRHRPDHLTKRGVVAGRGLGEGGLGEEVAGGGRGEADLGEEVSGGGLGERSRGKVSRGGLRDEVSGEVAGEAAPQPGTKGNSKNQVRTPICYAIFGELMFLDNSLKKKKETVVFKA